MAEVAYLLGAGASAECIPVVNGMADKIKKVKVDLAPILAKISNSTQGDARMTFNNYIQQVNSDLDKLHRICEEYFSIDTYAKKLFITNREEFQKLKVLLCYYFALLQIIERKDKRYDNLFASIINEKQRLPQKIKIFSWNYDCQLELSYSQFSYNATLNNAREELHIQTPRDISSSTNSVRGFHIVKLNGSASFKDDVGFNYLIDTNVETKNQRLENLITNYCTIINSGNPIETDLKFAWENQDYEDMFRKLQLPLSKIKVVVIVGYSFPFFNREVDEEFFVKLNGLQKIYIQDVNPKAIHETMSEFLGPAFQMGSKAVIYKENLSQFVFPRELDVKVYD